MYMLLDVNTEVYRMRIGDKFTMALAHTLNLDGTPDTGYYTPVSFLLLWFWLPVETRGVEFIAAEDFWCVFAILHDIIFS